MARQQTVHIVDDDAAVRKALVMLMQSDELQVESYASAEEFIKNVTAEDKGCILLDVRMPGMSGLELQQLLREQRIGMPVIIMTGFADVAMAVEAMKAGASDFIEKPFDNDYLLKQVKTCLQKSEKIQSAQDQQQAADDKIARLTRREREVMDMLVAGHQNRVIAEKLGISPRTVEIHRARVMEKLETHSLSGVVRIALSVADTA
ncbi:MAG: response regulator [Gammaproteobacteria bacterium]|jgi:two-component system, LuxR family, response regulator FixJ